MADDLNEALEVLRENIQRILARHKIEITLEETHLIAAVFSALQSAGFESLKNSQEILQHAQNVNNMKQLMKRQAEKERLRKEEWEKSIAAHAAAHAKTRFFK